DRLRLYASRVVRISHGPDPFLKSIDGKIAAPEDAVEHREARASPFADLAFDNDLVIEAAGKQKLRALLHQRHADHSIDLPHLGGRQTSAREQQAGVRVEHG